MSGSTDRSRSSVPWWVAWAAMAAITSVALVIGVSRDDGPQTAQDRVTALARLIKCPTCAGESAAESNSPAAKAIRIDLAERVEQGQTDDAIIDAYANSPLGDDLLLTPSSSGVIGLVWILPVVFLALAVAGLVLAFVRWRRMPTVHATDADRDLVAEARSGRADASSDGDRTGGDSSR